MNKEAASVNYFNIYPTVSTSQFHIELETSDLTMKAKLVVLANITNSFFNIGIENLTPYNQTATIRVFNALGMIVLTQQAAITNDILQTQINLDAALPQGLYFVKVNADSENYSGKILLQ